MVDFHHIHSRFEADGIFWEAKDPTSTFTAHLSSSVHIELTISAEIAGPERMFWNPAFDTSPPDHCLGLTTTMGPCTLIGLHELPTQTYFVGLTTQVVLARRYRVDACIIGLHLESDTEPLLRSGWIMY